MHTPIKRAVGSAMNRAVQCAVDSGIDSVINSAINSVINGAINKLVNSAVAKATASILLAGPLVLVLSGCSPEDFGGEAGPGSAGEGRMLIERTGCGSCHRIPGIASAQGQVGPPLDRLSRRVYLAGVLPNNFKNLVLWIKQPQKVAPGSAMPNMGLNDAEAESIAAYLYTLE